uniref:Large ribosomal subunit protein eL28 n=1 Tax=Maconellicoccus hirsutus TaxID=177089 RepID=A2I410_MACHI|nr:ribosomal protein L28-like protein [Maconellicoccus hirsutus]
MSADLYWMITRNNNAYLLKKRDIKKPFSTEPGNLKNVASFRYNGLVQPKTVDVRAAKDGKGFVVTTKRAKQQNKPGKSNISVTMSAGPRRSLYKLRRYLDGGKYRKDLTQVALRKASAILESQKRSAIIAKKGRAKKSE